MPPLGLTVNVDVDAIVKRDVSGAITPVNPPLLSITLLPVVVNLVITA